MSAAPSTTELAIGGMTCASCAARVRRALERVDGVSAAQVNLATERAFVEHGAAIGPSSLIGAVEAAGYAAKTIAADATAEEEAAEAIERARDLRRRRNLLVLGVVLALPTIVIGMSGLRFAGEDWLMLALTLPVWAIVGYDFHRSALASLRRISANMDTLVSVGSTAALAYSIAATLTMQPTYYETAAAIVVLISIGKYLELVMRAKSSSAVRGLLELRPEHVEIVGSDGAVRTLPIDSVAAGDVAIVRAGQRVPVDGVVIDGASSIDSSTITGESLPKDVEAGSTVIGGTLNGDGLLQVRATAVGAGTTLARIVKAVRDAQGSEAPAQRLADRVAGVFVPAMLLIAAATFAAWALTGHPLAQALMVAVSVVVVACPCAMGLATPTAVMAGVGNAARRGIVFRDARAMEAAGLAHDVVFDKTGTLTRGRPAVRGVMTAPGNRADEVLSVAAAAEASSTHPIARALTDAARASGLMTATVTQARAIPGGGVVARVGDLEIAVGSPKLMSQLGVAGDGVPAQGDHEGVTRVEVARGGRAIGAIVVADPIRPESAEAVAALGKLGLCVSMVSGDAEEPVQFVAANLGIGQARSQMSPTDKAAYVRDLQAAGRPVVFVGDGVNDAPALAAATVGIAMGGGSDIAIESAGASVLSDDPRAIAAAIVLSRATARTIRQNLAWALIYNVILVPLAAFGFVHPIFAAGAMGASSLFVVGNSLLLARRNGRDGRP